MLCCLFSLYSPPSFSVFLCHGADIRTRQQLPQLPPCSLPLPARRSLQEGACTLSPTHCSSFAHLPRYQPPLCPVLIVAYRRHLDKLIVLWLGLPLTLPWLLLLPGCLPACAWSAADMAAISRWTRRRWGRTVREVWQGHPSIVIWSSASVSVSVSVAASASVAAVSLRLIMFVVIAAAAACRASVRRSLVVITFMIYVVHTAWHLFCVFVVCALHSFSLSVIIPFAFDFDFSFGIGFFGFCCCCCV